MNIEINWPGNEFTIEEAIALNPAFPQQAVRKRLSSAIERKAIVQTQKGNQKVKGKFKLVNQPG